MPAHAGKTGIGRARTRALITGAAWVVAFALMLAEAAADPLEGEPPRMPGDERERMDLEATVTGVVQGIDAGGAAEGEHETRGTYRGDVGVTLPGGRAGDVTGKIFVHVRFGRGSGVALRPTYTSTPNSTAFQTPGANDPYGILAQAWYQLTLPVAAGSAQPPSQVEITAGKIDPFVFFDQNPVADDETRRFMSNAFVHNPLLDSGGDLGANRHGFTPGVRVAYAAMRDDSGWALSLGVFGSGPDANLTGALGDAFTIAQAETTGRAVGGQPGTLRLYAWRNGRAVDFVDAPQRHSGWGLSADQQFGEAVTLFTRLGAETQGQVRFDRALTLGAEIAATAFGRASDAFGVALGFLRTSGDYRAATADGTLAGYAASGTERDAEIYYRIHVGEHVEITPDLQWIARPAGDASAPTIVVGGVRARIGL
jgi:high affinity Mn2+ porin